MVTLTEREKKDILHNIIQPSFLHGTLTYVIVAVVVAVVSCLPWGSFGWMTANDFRQLDNSAEYDSLRTFVPSRTLVVRVRGQAFNVPAGETVEILGQYRELPETNQDTDLLVVQTKSGLRGTATIADIEPPKILLHDHARSDDAFMFHLLAYEKDLRKFIGQDLRALEADYGPVIDIQPWKDGRLTATMMGYNMITEGGDYYRGVRLWLSPDMKVSDVASVTDYGPAMFQWMAKTGHFWMSHSVAYMSPGCYVQDGHMPYISSVWYEKKWVARAVMGFLDIMVIFCLCLLCVTVAEQVLYRVKSLSNEAIVLAETVAVLLLGTPYMLFTMELSPALFGVIWVMLSTCIYAVWRVSSVRCPHCHSVVKMVVDGRSEGQIVTTDSVRRHSKDSNFTDDYDQHNDQRVETWDTTHYVTNERQVRHQYTIICHCPSCGKQVDFAGSRHLFSGRFTTVTGKEHTTKTTTYR